jgi:hypothetical protein
MNCAYHLTNRAVVQCSRCGRPLCPACDHRIRGFPYCQDCIVAGVEFLQQQQSRPGATTNVVRRKTSGFVALLLSFICPGLGAAYNGQTSKALVHFTIFASFFQMATVTDGAAFFVLGVVGTWLFAAVDAVRTAQLIRAGLAPGAERDAIARRLYGNPLAWAVTMIVLGTVFLLHTVFNVRLPVREFLPVVLVLLGAYMLFDWARARRGRELPDFETVSRTPSVFGGATTGTLPGEVTRFGTGELITQVTARAHEPTGAWPSDPRL